MSRKEFMIRLEQLLAGVSEEERTDALQYYEDYFDDAGTENEQNVVEELGSPEKVAAIIRMNLSEGSREGGEFTEQGYQDERFEYRETPATWGEGAKKDGRYSTHYDKEEDAYEYNETENPGKHAISPKMNRFLKVVLVVLIVLVGCPVVIPVVIGVAAAVIGIIVGIYAMFAAFVIAAGAIALAGLCIIAVGVVRVGIMFPSAILMVGIGLLLFTLGLIGAVAAVRLCMVMYPAIFRIIVKICRWPFHRRKAVA